jgi:hypothetical protein
VKAAVSPRVLIWTVVLLVLGAALGGGGYWAYLNFYQTPENLYAWADKAYRKADSVTDAAEKKKQLEYADGYLVKMLDKDSTSSKGWFLRYNVHKKFHDLARAQEEESGDKEHQKSKEYAQNWALALDRAIQCDKNNVMAVATAQDIRFLEDDIPGAEPYSELLVGYQRDQYKDLPKWEAWLAAAHYVLARRALSVRPPQPDEALEQLRAIKEIKSPNPPRWREIDLETAALMLKADEIRKTAKGAADTKNPAQELLDQQVPKWLQRAEDEVKNKPDIPGTDKDHPPIPFVLHTVLPTNIRGHLSFLVRATELAPSAADLVERANLLLKTGDKMLSYPKVEPKTVRAVADSVAKLPSVLMQARHSKDLRPEQWAALTDGVKKLSDKALAAGAPVAPEAYLQLAEKAHRELRYDDAYNLAVDGLKAAEARKLPADASAQEKERRRATFQALQGEAAWLMLLQNRPKDAEKHLLVMREQKGTAAAAHLIEGMSAAKDGRFEEAVQHLQAAMQDPKIARGLYPTAGLAVSYMALGEYDKAEKLLLALERNLKAQKLTAEEKLVTGDLVHDLDDVNRQLMRCYLGMNQPEKAMPYKESLENRPGGMAARLLLIYFYINRGRAKLAQGENRDARDDFDDARKELNAAQKIQPDDPAVVWADAMLTASQPETNAALAAEAAAAIAAAPSDAAQQAAARAKLNKALNWNLKKAEDVLTKYKKKKDLASAALWYNWLVGRRRLEEANLALEKMEEDYPDRARELKLLRARLAIERGKSAEAGRLVESLQAQGGGPQVDALAVLNLLLKQDNPAARKVLDALISKQENDLQLHDWRAWLAYKSGDFAEAARSFCRCLGYTQYKRQAEFGVLDSLISLAAKESPRAAAELADKLLADHPYEPVLLLASAELACQMENIDGPQGMVARLKEYEARLAQRPGVSPANGADRLARAWSVIGRVDLARRELERALKMDPDYAPALLLTARLAATELDWNECLNASTNLVTLLESRRTAARNAVSRSVLDHPEPLLIEAMYYRGRALEELERPEDARQVYRDLIIKHPENAAGYLGMARVRERLKDYKGALDLVRQWRERQPADPNGIAQEVRLLVLAGKPNEADRAASQFVERQMRRSKAEQAAEIAKRPPPKDDQEKERRAADDKLALAMIERNLHDLLARVFLSVDLNLAESWAIKALNLAKALVPDVREEKLPKAVKDQLADSQWLLGDIAYNRSKEKKGQEKEAEIAKAIAAYQKAWDLNQNAFAGNNIASLLSEKREHAEAAYSIVQKLRRSRSGDYLVPGDRLKLEFLDTLGKVYLASEHPREVIELFKQAQAHYKDEPVVYMFLGKAYHALGQKRLAYENLNLAIVAAVAKAEAAKDQTRKDYWKAEADKARDLQKKFQGAKQ